TTITSASRQAKHFMAPPSHAGSTAVKRGGGGSLSVLRLWRQRPYRGAVMTVHIVRLGSPRLPGEGLRIGTVRHPPRGVPKSEYAERGFYEEWCHNLAPSAEAVKATRGAATDKEWAAFARRYRAEMATPENRR